MHIVEVAENHPNVCLVTRDPNGPFVDFGTFTTDVDPHIYLSVAVVKQAAEMLGMVEVEGEVERLREQVDVLSKKVQNLTHYKESIDALAEQEAALEEIAV